MKATKIQNTFAVVELTNNEIQKINEILAQKDTPTMNEWGGTEYGLIYNPETQKIELWDGQIFETELIEPEKVEIV